MKIKLNKLKIVPNTISVSFKLCYYGVDDEIENWINHHNFIIEKFEKYTNIVIPDDIELSELFLPSNHFDWLDGFSPNLNKKLHIGHFSNLILGKAFKSLGICNSIVSIYGDTLTGEISKEDAIQDLKKYQNLFEFHPDKEFMASEMKYNGKLYDGTNEYIGTKVFQVLSGKPIDFQKELLSNAFLPIVGIKSDGSTSYFYQDAALAELLNASTLYLTGSEQMNHFKMLKYLFPHIDHIGLGLVKLTDGKMSSRLGNVIFIEDFINSLLETFNNNYQLIYNVFAGFILKSSTHSEKNINTELISNPKNSAGLYISYTMARLNSAGCELITNNKFNSKFLEFALLRAKNELEPSILFKELVEHCKDINVLYMTHHIKDNPENKKLFQDKLSDLIHGCNMLGLFIVDKV